MIQFLFLMFVNIFDYYYIQFVNQIIFVQFFEILVVIFLIEIQVQNDFHLM
jgi:hypothetical protein